MHTRKKGDRTLETPSARQIAALAATSFWARGFRPGGHLPAPAAMSVDAFAVLMCCAGLRQELSFTEGRTWHI